MLIRKRVDFYSYVTVSVWNEFRDRVCFSVSSIVLRMSKQTLVTSSKDVENFSKT